MKYLFLIIFSIFTTQNISAQIYEIGVFAGGSNFIGDVGNTNFIAPNQPAFGVLAKWNRSERHAYRLSLINSKLVGIDANSDDPRREQRGYGFENNITELSAGFEFTFFDFDLHPSGTKSTPYLYTGITATNHQKLYFAQNGRRTYLDSKAWAFAIPMVLGFKTTITDHFIFGAEVGARYTFTDALDGSLPDLENNETANFGNTNSNDWYVFSGVTLTYTFGRKPCFCNY